MQPYEMRLSSVWGEASRCSRRSFGSLARTRVHGNCRVVVNPDDVFTAGVAPALAFEAARRCGAFVRLDQRDGPTADAFDRIITDGSANQNRRCAAQGANGLR